MDMGVDKVVDPEVIDRPMEGVDVVPVVYTQQRRKGFFYGEAGVHSSGGRRSNRTGKRDYN
jgi:hypothetical protein